MVSVVRHAAFAAFPLFVFWAPCSAASTSIGGSPSGDIALDIDWNVNDPTGGALFRTGSTSAALLGFSNMVIGTQQGAALTSASVGALRAGVYKDVTRTANQAGINNNTSLPAGASANFFDVLTFAGGASNFSFTITPDLGLGTADLGFDFGEDAPNLASVERNFSVIEAEILISYAVRNADNSVAYTIQQGSYERLNSFGLYTSRGRFSDPSFQDIAPVDFELTPGQTLVISGSAYAYVSVFSSVDAGPGAADAYASVKLSLEGLTPGWDYTTESGGRLPVSAIPEPSSLAVLCGLAALGVVTRRRRATR